MLGTEPDPQPKVRAKTTKRIVGVPGFRTFIRVLVRETDGKLYAEPLRAPGSGILTTLTRANGIVVIPENLEGYDEGVEIEVQLFRPVERGENAGRP
jgi:molybdopterin molybdotransferase